MAKGVDFSASFPHDGFSRFSRFPSLSERHFRVGGSFFSSSSVGRTRQFQSRGFGRPLGWAHARELRRARSVDTLGENFMMALLDLLPLSDRVCFRNRSFYDLHHARSFGVLRCQPAGHVRSSCC